MQKLDAVSELIGCHRRALACSVAACVQDWRRAQARKPFPWESRWHCRGCVEGAARAGVSAAQAVAVRQIDSVLHTCTRCHRQAERLIRQRFCLSCYNRELELQKGRNGKGTSPVVLQARYPLHIWRLRFRPASLSGDWQWQRPVERAVDTLEAMLTLIHQERTLLTFARSIPDFSSSRQLGLWGGL